MFTAESHLAALASGLITFKLAALSFGLDGFGAYALARRAISIVAFPMLMGLGVSLPRFVAADPRADGPGRGGAYFLASWLVALPGLALLFALAAAIPATLAGLVFGEDGHGGLVWPMAVAVAGLCAHTIIYGWQIGRLRMWSAGSLWLVNLAVVPPSAVAISGGSVASALLGLGVGWSVSSALAGVVAISGLRAGPPRAWVGAFRELVRFGVPRMPGELALFGLFALPPILIAHRSGLEEAGMVSFGLSLVQMVGSVFTAAGMLLLPIVSRLRVEGRIARARRLIDRAMLAAVGSAVLIVLAVEAGLDSVIALMLDDSFAAAAGAARRLLPAAVPFVAYIVLRGPLDALEDWPHSAVNLGLALGVTALLLVSASGAMEVATASLAGFVVLGVASVRSLRRCLARADRSAVGPSAPEPSGEAMVASA